MANAAWPENFTMEDLQNLPLPDISYDDLLLFDSERLDSRLHAAPSTQMTCTQNPCACGRVFRRRSDLKKHIDKRTRPYACSNSTCTVRPFSTKHDRDRHEREVHDLVLAGDAEVKGNAKSVPAVKVRCPVVSCKRHSKGFARKENLALHVRNMHPEGAHAQSPWAQGVSTEVQHTPPAQLSPATAAMPLSPTLTTTTTSSGSTPDAVLLAGLNERLGALQSRRQALFTQLSEVESTIEAVARTVQELQGGRMDIFGGIEGWDWGDEGLL